MTEAAVTIYSSVYSGRSTDSNDVINLRKVLRHAIWKEFPSHLYRNRSWEHLLYCLNQEKKKVVQHFAFYPSASHPSLACSQITCQTILNFEKHVTYLLWSFAS